MSATRTEITPDLAHSTADPSRDVKVLLSVEEAAERLDIGRTLLYELIRTRRIRTIHVGRLRKVPVESLREFVDQQRALATADGS
jgi:excisionase family DNA binding protein